MSRVSWTWLSLSQLSTYLIWEQWDKITGMRQKAGIILLKIAFKIRGEISDTISCLSFLKVDYHNNL